MATFRFHLIGAHAPVEIDVDARSIEALGALVTQQRFIVGRLTKPDEDGVLPGVLIATSLSSAWSRLSRYKTSATDFSAYSALCWSKLS